MTAARLDESKVIVRNESRNGASQKIRRGNEIGVENGHIRCIGMIEAVGEISSLEPIANTAPEDLQLHIGWDDRSDSLRQDRVVFCAAVIEQLDFEPVPRPVEGSGSGGDADSQPPLIADRELNQNPR